eukprot:2632876-Amphidinium_carterae.1
MDGDRSNRIDSQRAAVAAWRAERVVSCSVCIEMPVNAPVGMELSARLSQGQWFSLLGLNRLHVEAQPQFNVIGPILCYNEGHIPCFAASGQQWGAIPPPPMEVVPEVG